MDPVYIAPNPDANPVGRSVFIPFEGFNPRIHVFASGHRQGQADFKLAADLPPMNTIHDAKLYIMNNRFIGHRIIEYREYSYEELARMPELLAYLRKHEGVRTAVAALGAGIAVGPRH